MSQLPLAIAAIEVLWYRRHGRAPWQLIATNESETDLAARAAALPSGDTIVLPQGENPNRTWPRVPGR